MSDDQLEEYRKLMQEKHRKKEAKNTKSDEQLAKEMQEEEYLRSEESKRSREAQPLIAASSNPSPSSYPPAMFSSHGQSAYPPISSSAHNNSVTSHRNNNESQVLVQRQPESFLPKVNDKCCGVNSQVAVLTVAGLMVVAIITAAIFLAVT